MKPGILTIFGLMLAALSLMSCNDDKAGGITDLMRTDMVTFEEESDAGTLFSMQEYEDSPMMYLMADGVHGTKLNKGERTMLGYYTKSAESPDKANIAVQFRIPVIFDSLRVAAKERIREYEINPVELKSIWRTGNFVNINTFVQYTDKQRFIALIVDEATLGRETVEAYFVDDILGHPGYYYRQAYISFFTGNLWAKYPDSKTLRIYINDTSYPKVKYYDITKPKI